MTYTLNDEIIDIEEFLRANAEDDQVPEDEVRSLGPGDAIVFGCGASPVFMLRRLD